MFFSIIIPDSWLHADAFCSWHEFIDTTIGIVRVDPFSLGMDSEVPEIRQSSSPMMSCFFDHFRQPFGITGESSMVFDDHIDIKIIRKLTKLTQTRARNVHGIF